jgi:kumamolisin
VHREPLPRSSAPLTLTLHLRSRGDHDTLRAAFEAIIAGHRATLTRAEFARQFGTTSEAVNVVRRFARKRGFRVSQVNLVKRTMHLTGPASRLAQTFGVNRARLRRGDTTWDSFTGYVYLPRELAGSVIGVLGFDGSPELRRRHAPDELATAAPKPKVSYTAREVAALYRFPPGLDGRGQSVGVIALGGGYLASDMRHYFRALSLPTPRIRSQSVVGAKNKPRGSTAQYDGEVTGDVQTVGAIAPRARITVYFAPNTPRGFFEAVAAAVHDPRARNSVISISWGQAEVHWRKSLLLAFNEVLLEAAVLGVTVCCSSGDQGSFADAFDRTPHVNFPGSSPFVLSCGGTTLMGKRTRIGSERVWHNETGASGGGVSEMFPRPHWQAGFRVPRTAKGYRGRGIPDVASNADPLTGYRVYVHGGWGVGAGTSASSPLWAGLVARINQHAGTAIGLPTPYLYREFDRLVRAGAVVPVTRGNNGLYHARKGWSCCTGAGSPRGDKLARAFARHHRRKKS